MPPGVITRVHNWGYWEELNDVELRDGDVLTIRWPSGAETTEPIKVERGKYEYTDHGHQYEGPAHESYVERKVEGVLVRVPLKGLEARRG